MRKILILVLMTCCLISCDINPNDTTNGNRSGNDNGPPTGMTGRIDMVRYVAADPCRQGAYSQYPDGVKSYEFECWDNGSRKKISRFSTENGKDIYKSGETLFLENGLTESQIGYNADGNKSLEYFHRADGTRRKFVQYHPDGSLFNPIYFDANSVECPDDRGESVKCVDTDPI